MKRVIAKAVVSSTVVSIAALMLGNLTGCDALNPVDSDKASISIDSIGTISVSGTSANEQLGGKIEGDPQIDNVVFRVLRNGTEVPSSEVRVITSGFNYTDETSVDLDNVTLQVDESACDGIYVLEIEVDAGSNNSSKEMAFDVTGATDCSGPSSDLTEETVTMGSWDNNNHGQALDADDMTVYMHDDVTSSLASQIDVWFSNTGEGQAWLWSPQQAATADYAPQDWNIQNNTQFVKVNADYDNITTQAQIDSIWSANSSASSNYANISAGDVVVLETNEDNHVIMEIVDANGTDTGTANIKGKF
ncbi:MAG: hypothetical protein ACOC4C_05400 [Fibrobacterota bacterium]